MKRILLSLLTCSIGLSAFAQIDTSNKANPGNTDKWEIVKENKKSTTGRLYISLPNGVEWDMTIYSAKTKTVISNSQLKTSFVLLPGVYDLEINHIMINNVPVEKGNSTRIKAGVLHITTSEAWTLYDSLKKIVLINSYAAQNRGLPIGKYILTILGNDQEIEIIDEEQKRNITEPVATLPGTGRIVLKFPLETLEYSSVLAVLPLIIKIYKAGAHSEDDLIYKCGMGTGESCPPSYPLMEGNYDVCFDPSLYIRNVNIKKGTETRLSVGYLTHLAAGLYHLYDETFQTRYWSYHSQGSSNLPTNSTIYFPANHPLPAGRYGVELQYIGRYRIQVKNGEITRLNPMDSALIRFPAWSVKPLSLGLLDRKPDRNLGRLNVSYPQAGNHPVQVWNYQDSTYINYEDKLNYIDLLPGKYGVILTYFRIDVNIEAGKETSIKFGYLKTELPQFEIRLAIGNSANISLGAGSYVLPINYYYIRVGTRNYLIRIKEGETLEFKIDQ